MGKTAVLRRYVSDLFDERYAGTIGTRISKNVTVLAAEEAGHDYRITNLVWDIKGNLYKKEPRLFDVFLEGAEGALVMFDSTREETFEEASGSLARYEQRVGHTPLVFVANKVDAAASREFAERLLNEQAREWKAPCYLTSAKTGEGVETAFKALSREMLRD